MVGDAQRRGRGIGIGSGRNPPCGRRDPTALPADRSAELLASARPHGALPRCPVEPRRGVGLV